MITLTPVDPDAPALELTDAEMRIPRRIGAVANILLIAWPASILLSNLTPCHLELLHRLAMCH